MVTYYVEKNKIKVVQEIQESMGKVEILNKIDRKSLRR